MRLSASKVDSFFGCRRQFKYQYLAKPFREPPNKYFIIGNIAHFVLECFYKAEGTTLDKNERSNLMGENFKAALRKYGAVGHIRKGIITREDIVEIRGMLKSYLGIVGTLTRPVNNIEEFFEIKIDGITVAGKADRIDRENDIYTIVDYKTSKKPKFSPTSVQMPTYAIWLGEKLGLSLEQIHSEYYYLRHMGKKNGIKEFDLTEKSIQDAKDRYHEVEDSINDTETKYCKNTKHFCWVCTYKSYCIGDNNDYVE